MLKVEEIKRVYKSTDKEVRGYYIEFNDGQKIHLTKRRTIIALLILVKYGEGTEADLAKGSSKIPEIRKILKGKIPDEYIQDYYGDANKPYSELWNEEGFTFIDNLKGGRRWKSQKYTLRKEDHPKLFSVAKKAFRRVPNSQEKEEIRKNQNNRCNLCGVGIVEKSKLKRSTFAKDRRREVFDHRKPVEKGGGSTIDNFQALCFYCNKSKWQICNICSIDGCDKNCALRNPESSKIISPTKENISDLLADRDKFSDE